MQEESLTFGVSEHFHATAEHRTQHGVVLLQGAYGGVMERAPDVEFDILRRVFNHRLVLARHNDDSGDEIWRGEYRHDAAGRGEDTGGEWCEWYRLPRRQVKTCEPIDSRLRRGATRDRVLGVTSTDDGSLAHAR